MKLLQWQLAVLIMVSPISQAVEIHFSEKVQTQLMPDRLTAALDVGFTDTQRHVVAEQMAKIVQAFKSLKNQPMFLGECQGGGVAIYPEYQEVAGLRVESGYVGQTHFSCWVDSARTYDLLVSAIPNYFRLSQSPLSWSLSPERQRQAYENLRLELMSRGMKVQEGFSQRLGNFMCNLTRIDFNESRNLGMAPTALRAMADAPQTQTPLGEEVTLELRADFVAQCQPKRP